MLISIPSEDTIVNAANEGIPVAAIARIIKQPLDEIYDTLRDAQANGSIVDLPRADWPPGVRTHDHLPALPLPNDADLQFMCAKQFKLTALEAAFLVCLIKNRHADKGRLHGIVEHQRNTRNNLPNEQDSTDPKMVDVMICKLRKKLKTVDKALKIETIWGSGYYIETTVKPLIIAHLEGTPHAPAQEPRQADSTACSNPYAN